MVSRISVSNCSLQFLEDIAINSLIDIFSSDKVRNWIESPDHICISIPLESISLPTSTLFHAQEQLGLSSILTKWLPFPYLDIMIETANEFGLWRKFHACLANNASFMVAQINSLIFGRNIHQLHSCDSYKPSSSSLFTIWTGNNSDFFSFRFCPERQQKSRSRFFTALDEMIVY